MKLYFFKKLFVPKPDDLTILIRAGKSTDMY